MKNVIVFTIDDSYVMPFCVALYSFTLFHEVEKYKIIVLHSTLSENSTNIIASYGNDLGIEVEIIEIEDVFTHIQTGYHFNSVIFYRLLIPELFPSAGKVLYLDSDIVFNGNIDDLFTLDLTNNIIAAIPRTEIGIPKNFVGKKSEYFASGLILFNINVFKKSEVYSKVINYLENESYEMPDQDALNCIIQDWIPVNLKYGVETSFFEYKGQKSKELECALENPVIIQFSGSVKPWHFANSHCYKKIFLDYLKYTPFHDYKYFDFNIVTIFKKYVWYPMKKLL